MRRIFAAPTVTAITTLTISADTSNYDVFVAASSPAVPTKVILSIDSGVVVSDDTRAGYALKAGGPWPNGSSIWFTPHSTVCGYGGDGGNGGDDSNGGVGGDGGTAILFDYPVAWHIDASDGLIAGGGGGGGGGGGELGGWGLGGGGGGGRGLAIGAGGGAGAPAATGYDGSYSAPGFGGAGQPGNFGTGGDGGQGGDWGQTGYDGFNFTYPGLGDGGIGGQPGKAIDLNGYAAPQWLGGYDGTHVKGAVS